METVLLSSTVAGYSISLITVPMEKAYLMKLSEISKV
jgi:hypothetical protein